MKQYISNILTLALSAASLAWAPVTTAQIGGPIIDTESAIFGGNGCDANSASLSTLMDMQGNYVMVLSLYEFLAHITPRIMAARESCAFRVKASIPAGRTLRIVSVTAYGDASYWGAAKGSAAISLTLFGKRFDIADQQIRGRFEPDFILSRNLSSDATIRASNRPQLGLIGLNAAASLQAVSRDAEGAITLSSIEIKYRVD